jgi:hypothetical protein
VTAANVFGRPRVAGLRRSDSPDTCNSRTARSTPAAAMLQLPRPPGGRVCSSNPFCKLLGLGNIGTHTCVVQAGPLRLGAAPGGGHGTSPGNPHRGTANCGSRRKTVRREHKERWGRGKRGTCAFQTKPTGCGREARRHSPAPPATARCRAAACHCCCGRGRRVATAPRDRLPPPLLLLLLLPAPLLKAAPRRSRRPRWRA